MTARERLFAALNGEPTDRLPIWLLFPYHYLGCYVDVRTHPGYREIFEYSKERVIMLNRRSIGVPLFQEGHAPEQEGKGWIRSDEELTDVLSRPILRDRGEIHTLLDVQFPKYLHVTCTQIVMLGNGFRSLTIPFPSSTLRSAKRRSEMKTRYDVAIIGGGVSGLTAGAILAKAGLNVGIFEKEPQTGGYLAAFTRGGFRFDSSVKWLNECAPGGMVHRVFSFIGDDMPVCPVKKRIKRYIVGERQYLLTDDPFQMLSTLAADYPEAAGGLAKFGGKVRLLADKMKDIQTSFRAPETMSPAERLRFALRMGLWFLPISPLVRMSGIEGLAKYFGDSPVRLLFPSEQTFMAVITPFAWALSHNYQNLPPGGSSVIPQWLSSKLVSSGGAVHTGCRVTGVSKGRGANMTLTLEDGAEIQADYVLSSGDIHSLYSELLTRDTRTQRIVRKLESAEVYDSEVNVFLGLDCPAGDLGMGEEMVTLFTPNLERCDHNTGDPDTGAITVVSPTATDPSLAPAGKGTLAISMACPYPAWRGLERNSSEYRDRKEKYAERLISRIERGLLPGLSAHIECVNVATPLTYQRYTGNRFGSIMGMRPSSRNVRNRLAFQRTAVPGLFLCGHWTEYGGGVPMAVKSAANAAILIMKELRHPAMSKLIETMTAPYANALT
jgi:phytoene dehydrogenase-like protein